MNVKMSQQGFTLIELMIVVAIIGILAAVAIPSYSDYTARSQITEAVGLTSAFKTGMAEYYSNQAVWPNSLTAVGDTTSGKYVNSMTIQTGAGVTGDLVITAVMNATGVNTGIQSGVYALGTSDGGQNWECGINGVAAAETTIVAKYLPSACK